MLKTCLVLATCSLFYGCSSSVAAPGNALPVIDACFVSDHAVVPVKLEVASTRSERQTGLMGRTFLASNAGMLFEYSEPRSASHGFWMYKTLIALDIAYLDRDGIIGNIREMAPCESARGSDCPTYPAGVPFMQAVEMNAGFFQTHGIAQGDRLFTGENSCPVL